MLSQGPFSYNRFNVYEQIVEGKKPDFLDFDKDGDEKESFKKAVKDKKKGGCKKCGGDDCDCDSKKDSKKEAKESVGITKEMVINHLIENNYVNNMVSAEAMFNHITDEYLEIIEGQIAQNTPE